MHMCAWMNWRYICECEKCPCFGKQCPMLFGDGVVFPKFVTFRMCPYYRKDA